MSKYTVLTKLVVLLDLANIVCGASPLIYHNQIAVLVPGGEDVVERVARRSGMKNLGRIGDLQDYYLLESHVISKRSTDKSHKHHAVLAEDAAVDWFEQQHEKRRVKRAADTFPNKITDPLFKDQWFLNHGARDGSDMNVLGAWKLGYTGKNVVVTILDDGIQYNHPDLKQNYDPHASKDINDNDDDPMPQDNGDNKHGTRCAGEVAAVAYNEYCGVGVAYNASIGGVRMLDGMVNDAVEARSLSLNPSHIDIYSASWGPEDDGKTVDGPGPLAKQAFINGITSGRGGKGSIFVWASGNGGHHTDNCNCDGYTNSIFTLSISSATQGGFKPWYLEECSSTLATTYSSGTPGQDASITTVDQDARLRSDKICTSAHTGTSASAPLAAGVCALALEANRNLTWRDIQHVVIYTANSKPLMQESGWEKNAVGRLFSHKFGYGLLDAEQLVKLAAKWKEVPKQHICETRVETVNKLLTKATNMKMNVSLITDGCDNMLSKVRYLEHVQARISVKYFPRGSLKIILKSPRGTKSFLLFPRPKDRVASSFEDWPFLSVHFWGEDPTGEWQLEISNAGPNQASADGILKHWQLVLYGTETNPLSTFTSSLSLDRTTPKSSADSSNNKPSDTAGQTHQEPQSVIPQVHPYSCHKECSRGCTGPRPEDCNDCTNFVLNNTCVKVCPLGTYGSLPRDSAASDNISSYKSWLCLPCDPSCSACYGPGHDHCSGCTEDKLLLSTHSVCVPTCPDGYTVDNTSGTCQACTGQCRTCQTGLNYTETCTSCPPHLVLSGSGSCQARCGGAEYPDSGQCEPCHASCHSCVGGRDTQCGQCREGTFYFERRCVSYCPAGYASHGTRGECLPCPTGCDHCQADGGVCSTCRQGWSKTPEGLCLSPESEKCQPGMYSGKGTCLACHNSCETCVGPKDKDCSSCYPDHRLHISTCVETCPAGTKLSSQGNSCLSCPHACSSCKNETCTSCRSGYSLQMEDGSCLTQCKTGQFPDTAGVCQGCHLSCQDCSGPGSNQCSSCHGDKSPYLASGQCLDTCPAGSYREGHSYLCQPCHASCTACAGEGAGSCTACSSSQLLRHGFCVSCEAGYFLSLTSAQCHPCHSTCAQCTGPDANQCSACPVELQLDTWSSLCVPCCHSPGSSPCCDCSGSPGLCTFPARQVGQTVSPAVLGIVLLVLGVLGGTVVVLCVVRGSGSEKAQLGAGVRTVGQTAKYSRVSKDTSDKQWEESEDSSDGEEQFLIVDT
eukprot:GFUD01037990.1.p1 GENE.GFUD01037990.1~~GFUD01037990.1.p1  ORF type:complete len:1243 (+),score=296.02 GFUD01037990.1:82-3810(+)